MNFLQKINARVPSFAWALNFSKSWNNPVFRGRMSSFWTYSPSWSYGCCRSLSWSNGWSTSRITNSYSWGSYFRSWSLNIIWSEL